MMIATRLARGLIGVIALSPFPGLAYAQAPRLLRHRPRCDSGTGSGSSASSGSSTRCGTNTGTCASTCCGSGTCLGPHQA